MQDLNKNIKIFQNKVLDEVTLKTKGGIIDLLLKDIFKGDYPPPYTLEQLTDQIITNKASAYSVFEKYFITTKVRYKVFYNGEDITENKLKYQLPAIMDIIGKEEYSKFKKITNHTYPSLLEAETKYSDTSKVFDEKDFKKLKSGDYLDTSFGKTNVTVNLRPIMEELVTSNSKLNFTPNPTKAYNKQLIIALL
jgi:hypothetical protein